MKTLITVDKAVWQRFKYLAQVIKGATVGEFLNKLIYEAVKDGFQDGEEEIREKPLERKPARRAVDASVEEVEEPVEEAVEDPEVEEESEAEKEVVGSEIEVEKKKPSGNSRFRGKDSSGGKTEADWMTEPVRKRMHRYAKRFKVPVKDRSDEQILDAVLDSISADFSSNQHAMQPEAFRAYRAKKRNLEMFDWYNECKDLAPGEEPRPGRETNWRHKD